MEDSTRGTEKAEKKKKDQEDPVDAIAPAINIQDEQFAGLSTTPAFNCLHEEVVQWDSLLARQLPIPLKSSSTEPTPSPPNSQSSEEKEHLNAELEITKAKLCLVTQELEEKTAQLRDSQHKVNQRVLGMQVLKQENIQVVVLAQHVKTFSKQLDFLKKKVKHADQVVMELVRCKDELRNLDLYKAGMEELRKQNSILMEAKSMLEEQLTVARACCDQVEELQTENLQLKSKLCHLELERDAGQKRMEELLEENMVLQTQQKQCMSESAHMVWELEQLSENTDLLDDLSDASRKSSVLETKQCASSHILKLEKERQSLQSTIRDASQVLEESSLRCRELEEENQQLSNKIEKLQHELEGEKQTINDLQSFGEELFKEKEQMRSDMQMLRADSMRQIQVLEKDKDLLNQSMLLLQEASLGISEAYTKNIKEENKVLQLTVTDTSRKLSKLQFEKQILQRDMEQMQERVKQVEELKKKLHWLEKENKKLAQEFTLLTMMTTEKMDALECENQGLRLENQELSKSVDTLKNMSVQLEGLERENKQLNEENLKLRRMVKTMRFMRANMAQIEIQNQELEQEEEDLEALSRKWEILELSPQNVSAENMQLWQTLDSSSQKAQALQQEGENLEPQGENLAQQQDLEAQHLANKQLEWTEENKALEQEMAQLEKDKKLLEEAVKPPQQQVELEDAVLDDRAAKLSIALDQEMAHCKDVATELKELEKNNRHFTKEVTTHMKRLRTLRVDLVLEKVKSQQLNTKLDKLSQELEMRGRRQELPQQDNSSHSNLHKDVLKPKVEQGEMETVLNTGCGAQQQEQRTNAIAKSKNHRLQDELDRVNFLHQLLKGEREELHTHIRKLENSLYYSQLELSHQQAQFDQLKEQHQSLDNHCELLSHLKENLEKEIHHLMGQLNMLNQQNQELLEQNTESKEQYYEEQKQSIDQLNALQRNRKKLEEKAREHNESCDPALKKKHHWIGAKAFINFIQQKKEGGRGHLKSASDGTSWTLESSDHTMSSTSQPPESQLEHLEATPSCSKWGEEQDTPKVPSGKAARCIRNPFYRSNSNKKAKSTAAHLTFYKRLWCWSSPAGASSPFFRTEDR